MSCFAFRNPSRFRARLILVLLPVRNDVAFPPSQSFVILVARRAFFLVVVRSFVRSFVWAFLLAFSDTFSLTSSRVQAHTRGASALRHANDAQRSRRHRSSTSYGRGWLRAGRAGTNHEHLSHCGAYPHPMPTSSSPDHHLSHLILTSSSPHLTPTQPSSSPHPHLILTQSSSSPHPILI